MALRRWFTERGVSHPGAYSSAVLALGVLMCMIIAVTVSVQVTERSRERNRAATCLVIKRMIVVYSEPTPVTETGRNAAQAWTDLGVRFGCKEG